MKDYYATLRIQHGRLKSAMQDLGIESAAELSRRSGVSQQGVGELLNFRVSPRAKNGAWKKHTLAICAALGSEPIDLFPEHLDHEIPTNEIASFVDHAQLSGASVRQLGPREECERGEMSRTLDEVLGTLTDRERNVLKGRFWESKTLDEIASEQGVCRERIRMVEAKALRKMRHPSRLEKLADVCAFS